MKSKFLSYLFIAAALTFLPGCWNKNFQEPGSIEVEKRPTEGVVGGNFTRTWAAVQAAMSKFPVLKKDLDNSTGRAYLMTDWVRGKSDVLYHGYDTNRMPYVIRYKLYIYVVGDVRGGQTKVSIKNVEQYLDDVVTAGVDFQGAVQTWVKTPSSTLKENALLQQIDKLVRDPKFKAEDTE